MGEYRDTAWLCKHRVRKAKAQMDPNLPRNVKNNKAVFCQPEEDSQRKHTPLMRKTHKLVTMDEEKAEVLSSFFCLTLQWQLLFPHFSSGWTARQGLREQSPSH